MDVYLGWLWVLITVLGVAILGFALWYGTRHDRGGSRWRRPTDPAHAGAKPDSAESSHLSPQLDPQRRRGDPGFD
jgi:hypothetical protein